MHRNILFAPRQTERKGEGGERHPMSCYVSLSVSSCSLFSLMVIDCFFMYKRKKVVLSIDEHTGNDRGGKRWRERGEGRPTEWMNKKDKGEVEGEARDNLNKRERETTE